MKKEFLSEWNGYKDKMIAVGISADFLLWFSSLLLRWVKNTKTELGQEIKGGLVGEEMTVSRAIRGILRLPFLSVFLSFWAGSRSRDQRWIGWWRNDNGGFPDLSSQLKWMDRNEIDIGFRFSKKFLQKQRWPNIWLRSGSVKQN